MSLQSEITLEGIDQAIAGLGYRNESALKYRLVAAIREYYLEDGTPDPGESHLGEELIRALWDVDGDPEALKSKKKNLSSVKSSVNADLRRLYKEGRNPEGIVIGPENLFVISDEAKDDLLRSLGARIEETGTATLKEIKDVLSVLNGVLSKASLAGEMDGAQGEGGLSEIKGLLQGLLEKVGSGGLSQGMGSAKAEDRSPTGAEGLLGEPELQEVLEVLDEPEDLLEVEEMESEQEPLDLMGEEFSEVEGEVLEEDLAEAEELEVSEEPEEDLEEIELAESEGEILDLPEQEEGYIADEEGVGDGSGEVPEQVASLEVFGEEPAELTEAEELEDLEVLDEPEDLLEVEETEGEPGTPDLTGEEFPEVEGEVLEEDLAEAEELEVSEEPEQELEEIELAESEGEILDLAEEDLPGEAGREQAEGEGLPFGESEVLEGFQAGDFIEPMEEVVPDWDLDDGDAQDYIDEDETSFAADELVEDDLSFPIEEFVETEGTFLSHDLLETPDPIPPIGADMGQGPLITDDTPGGGEDVLEEVLPEEDLEVLEVDEGAESATDLSSSGDAEREARNGHGVEEPGRESATGDPAEGIGDEPGTHEDKVTKARILAEEFNRSLSAMDRYYNQHLLIPEGAHTVGAGSIGGREREERRIRLSSYYIGKFPVTNALFEIFVERTGYRTTAERCGHGTVYCGRYQRKVDERTGKETLTWNSALLSRKVRGACWYQPLGPGSNLHHKRNHPVVQVSLEDALAFAAWTGKRLPTEDEWEAASRTRGAYPYPWGDAFNSKACNLELSLVGDTTPVDRYVEFENPYGIADALGNVQEWTSETSAYSATLAEGAAYFIVKGGSWVSGSTVTLWNRVEMERQSHSNILGFRTVAY